MPYFENIALSRASTIHFEVDPLAIELFIGWLYRGASALTTPDDNLTPLFKLYVTAHKWNVPVLQNCIIDTILNWFPSKDIGTRLKTVKSIIQECWSDVATVRPLSAALLCITVEVITNKDASIEGVYSLICLDNNFSMNLAKWQVFVLRGGNLDSSYIQTTCYV